MLALTTCRSTEDNASIVIVSIYHSRSHRTKRLAIVKMTIIKSEGGNSRCYVSKYQITFVLMYLKISWKQGECCVNNGVQCSLPSMIILLKHTMILNIDSSMQNASLRCLALNKPCESEQAQLSECWEWPSEQSAHLVYQLICRWCNLSGEVHQHTSSSVKP